VKSILLNNEPFHSSTNDLPMLIHGVDHSGASLFTVTLAADLYRHGAKFLFISGYHYAREEFLEQTNDEEHTVLAGETVDKEVIYNKQVIFVRWEDAELFIKLVNEIPDVNDRIILVKNIDIMPEAVYSAVSGKPKIIISGDVERCAYRWEIFGKDFKSRVFFSKPEREEFDLLVPPLPKYAGYMDAQDKKGIVTKVLD
jgi:hypothetical protein